MILTLEDVGVSFGQFDVIKHIYATIKDGQKIGIVGKNGAGKSTLLKVINEEIEMYEGTISRRKNLEIGYLKQDSGLNFQNTVIEEMEGVFEKLNDIKGRMDSLSEKMGILAQTNTEEYNKVSEEYAELLAYFEQKDGYQTEYKIDIVLNGMGFPQKEYQKVVGNLSGGEKTRLALAKMVLSKPDLLILDEPTNHLDFKTLVWLENYLKDYPSAVLIVSHDRYFLDKLADTIWEIERGSLTSYKGNYTKFTELKEAAIKKQEQDYYAQQAERKRLQEYVDKNLVRASTTKMAQSRRRVLEKMELIEKPPSLGRPAKIRFNCVSNPYKDVLRAEGVQVSIDTEEGYKVLIEEINLLVERGQKIAIVGENGTGKSTFLKMVIGRIPVKKGRLTLGRHALVGYYDQEQRELNPNLTVLEQVWSRYPTMTELEVRSHLARVLFTGEEIEKVTSELSGGEKAKLAFALLMLTPSNVLILDEPTNHLDIYSNEVIENALKEYDGTILFVSHDRYLLKRVADSIVEFSKEGCIFYKYGFEQYEASVSSGNTPQITKALPGEAEEISSEKQAGGYKTKEQRREEAKRRDTISKLEKEIEQLEQEAVGLEEELTLEEVYTEYDLLQETTKQLDHIKKLIEKKGEQLLHLWEEEA